MKNSSLLFNFVCYFYKFILNFIAKPFSGLIFKIGRWIDRKSITLYFDRSARQTYDALFEKHSAYIAGFKGLGIDRLVLLDKCIIR